MCVQIIKNQYNFPHPSNKHQQDIDFLCPVRCSFSISYAYMSHTKRLINTNMLHVPLRAYRISFLARISSHGRPFVILREADKAFHPYTQLVVMDCMASHTHPRCLPFGLRILRFLWVGCTSRCSCEVAIRFF